MAALGLIVASAAGHPAARADVRVAPPFTNLVKGEDAEETYELNALGLTTLRVVGPIFVGPPPIGWEPSYGKYRKPIGKQEFLRLLGRDELIEEYRARRNVGIVILGVGASAVVGGIYLGLHRGWSALSYGLPLAGMLTVGVGYAFVASVSTFTASEALEACYRYDEALRARLGLPPLSAEPVDHHVGSPSLGRRILAGLRLGATPGGAAAGLLLSF